MEQLPFASTEIGHVYLTGTQDGKHATQTLVFLQGFSVLRPIHFSDEQINIVHLDSKEFTARLPDRDQLIDEGDQRKRIDTCLKSLWRQVLIDTKANVPAEQFVERYYPALRSFDTRITGSRRACALLYRISPAILELIGNTHAIFKC